MSKNVDKRDDVLRAMLDMEYTVGPTMRALAPKAGMKSYTTAHRYVRLLKDAGLVREIRVTPSHARYVLSDTGRERARMLSGKETAE